MKMNSSISIILISMLLVACDNSPTQQTTISIQKTDEKPFVEGELIPRSMSEKAKYYLITTENDGEYLKVIHSRVSSSSHGYSLTRIDCKNNRYQDLGYGDDQQSNIKIFDDTKWTDIISGSSKSDLVQFVCNKRK